MLEVLVTLAIIGLLVGLAIVNVGNTHRNAEKAAARLFVNQTLKTGLEQYRLAMGEYPSTAEGLEALFAAPAGKEARWPGAFLEGKSVLLDPWQERYQYVAPGKHNPERYDLWSKGPDKISGTADDIGNWDPPAAR